MREASDAARLRRLRALLAPRGRGGGWSTEELCELPRLYRHACSVVARLEASGADPRLAYEARRLLGRAHALLYRDRRVRARRLARAAWALFAIQAPRAIRAEWRLLAVSFVLVYALAALAGAAVTRDLDLASSLMDGGAVETEIDQLERTAEGEPFRGNFTFGLGRSPQTAGMILVHNMGVGVMFFASALVPPFYLLLLSTNALMLGTYTAVAGHWGQAGAISSILWCHGTLEIQALLLAGTAGLVLVRSLLRPGAWSRRHALQRASRRALHLVAPVFPMLFAAGLIEGFVSPHAPLRVRLAVAVASAVALLGWALLAGRRTSETPAPGPAPAGGFEARPAAERATAR